MSQVVLSEIKNGILSITMNRPKTLNVLSPEMIQGLNTIFEQAQQDAAIKVITLQGAGHNYMAGGDIVYFKKILNDSINTHQDILEPLVTDAQRIIAQIQQIDKPVVSIVKGVAVGFGLSLVLASDFAIAEENSIFSTAYAGIGLSPDGGASFILPKVVGLKKAKELLMLCDRFGANEALSLGLINHVASTEQLELVVSKLCQTLSHSAPVALANIKRLVNTSVKTTLLEQLDKEKTAFINCAQTQDFNTGVNAFLAKEKPSFKGK